MTERMPQQSPFGIGQLLGSDGSAHPFWSLCDSYATACEPMSRTVARSHLEWTSFVGMRMQAWAGIPAAMTRCRTPLDVLQLQMEFWETASHHYGEAAERLVSVWRGALPATDASSGANARVTRDYISVPDANADQASDARRHPGEKRKAA